MLTVARQHENSARCLRFKERVMLAITKSRKARQGGAKKVYRFVESREGWQLFFLRAARQYIGGYTSHKFSHPRQMLRAGS